MISVDWLSQWLVLIGIDRLYKSIISIDWLSQWFDLIWLSQWLVTVLWTYSLIDSLVDS